MSRRGFTLVEVAVATAMLATAGVALQSLVSRSLATIDRDVRRTRTLVAARSLLAESLLGPPASGTTSGRLADGMRWERSVSATRHPALYEVHVHVERDDGADATDLVELQYVSPR